MTIGDLKKLIGETLEWTEQQAERVRIAVVKNNRADYPEDGMFSFLLFLFFTLQKETFNGSCCFFLFSYASRCIFG